jgi:hypothetical protein
MACRRCDGHGLVEVDFDDVPVGDPISFAYRCNCPAGTRYEKKFPLAPPDIRVLPDPVVAIDARGHLAELKACLRRHPAGGGKDR